MSTEQNIQPRLLEPGYNIIQGRGGQALVLDVVGNMFLTSPNKPSEQQSELSIDKSVSSIAIMVNTGSIINTFKKYPSENFNTINQDQNIEENKVIIQSVQPTASSDLNIAVDVLPTSSVTSSVQTQVVEKPKSNKEIEVLFLPETEDIIFSPLYDNEIIQIGAESYSFLENKFTSLNITTSEENKDIIKPPTISSTGIETEEVIKAILQGLNIPINIATVNFIKAWRQAEGGNATWNLLNSTLPYNGSTKFNKVKVQNYKSKEDGIEANIITLKSLKYSKIVEGLKKINSLSDGYNLAIQLSDGPSNGPFYIWSLGYYDRILKLCARGNSIYNEAKLCPPPKSIKNEYIANILNFWNKNNRINFTNFIRKSKQ